MNHHFNGVLLDVLWKMSFQTGLTAILIWLVTRSAGKASARVRYALWLVVLIKFFVPPVAHVPMKLVPVHRSGITRSSRMPSVVSPHSSVQAWNVGDSVVSQGPVVAEAASHSASDRMDAVHSVAGKSAPWVLGLWFFGFMVMALVLAARLVLQCELIRRSVEASSELKGLLKEACDEFGIARVPDLRVSTGAATPMLLGLFRRTVLLPVKVADMCGRDDMLAMFLHELAHIKRRDILVLWLQHLARIPFFFHPGLWLVFRGLNRERELACDELVLSSSSITPKTYAAGYVAALKYASGSGGSVAVAMAEPLETEKSRIQRILHLEVPKVSVWCKAAVALLIACCLPTFMGVVKAAPSDAMLRLKSITAGKPVASGRLSLDHPAGEKVADKTSKGKHTAASAPKPASVNRPSDEATEARVLAGLTAIEGPGVEVTLRDSPKMPEESASSQVRQMYLVHDIDIKNVVNELGAAGAEAVSINGQRLVANSAIKACGKVILVNGCSINSPFVISAIGDPEALYKVFTTPGGVGEELKLLDMIKVEKKTRMVVPTYRGSTKLRVGKPL